MTKYEVKIKSLLMQLGNCLSDYSSILLDILQIKNEKKELLQEDLSKIGKELDKVVVEALKILDALDKSFYVNVPFENVNSISNKIGYIASCAKDARRRFTIAKEEKLAAQNSHRQFSFELSESYLRLRYLMLSSATAAMIIKPLMTNCKFVSIIKNVRQYVKLVKIITPNAAPLMFPNPPVNERPPTTHAAIASISKPCPVPALALARNASKNEPHP